MSNVNSTNFGKLYQFLANQGDNWYEEAAGQDGNLIYSEFYNYVTENWDGTGNTDADADLIKKFFNKLDTAYCRDCGHVLYRPCTPQPHHPLSNEAFRLGRRG